MATMTRSGAPACRSMISPAMRRMPRATLSGSSNVRMGPGPSSDPRPTLERALVEPAPVRAAAFFAVRGRARLGPPALDHLQARALHPAFPLLGFALNFGVEATEPKLQPEVADGRGRAAAEQPARAARAEPTEHAFGRGLAEEQVEE